MRLKSEESALEIRKHGRLIHATNPSIPAKDGITRHRQKRLGDDQKGLVINTGNGEILGRGAAVIYEWEEVDKERFVKLFIGGIKKASGLTKAGLLLFEAVYHQMRESHNSDQVRLSQYDASLPKMTKATYFRALAELLDAEILYKSPWDGTFFVDINCMFNGDRLAFVKGYHLRGGQTELPLLQPEQLADQTGGAV